MSPQEWVYDLGKEDMYFIGYSNGISEIYAQAKDLVRSRNEKSFSKAMLQKMAENIQKISKMDNFPESYKNGYKLAVTQKRIQLLKNSLNLGDIHD